MAEVDTIMVRLGEGLRLSQGGDRAAAQEAFALLWQEISQDDDPLHRCAVAHAMADVQDDVNAELCWDLQALEAADLISDARAAQAGVAGPVAGFYPSLHLNVGECYRKIGDLENARAHLERGQAAVGALRDDGYGTMIKMGLGRLADRLAET